VCVVCGVVLCCVVLCAFVCDKKSSTLEVEECCFSGIFGGGGK